MLNKVIVTVALLFFCLKREFVISELKERSCSHREAGKAPAGRRERERKRERQRERLMATIIATC